jgi:hypothetical protein
MNIEMKKKLVSKITCSTCRFYTWEFSFMSPKHDGLGRVHHPSCPCVRV